MIFPEATLRRKWKNLRDYFSMEYNKKGAERAKDDYSRPVSHWKFFHQLMFLRDIVANTVDPLEEPATSSPKSSFVVKLPADPTQKTGEKRKSETVDEESEMSDEEEELFETNNKLDLNQSDIKSELNASSNRLQLNQKNNKPAHTKQLPRASVTDCIDPNLLWLKSLLPYIKRIPEERQLSFRSKIHCIVEEFAFPTNEHLSQK